MIIEPIVYYGNDIGHSVTFKEMRGKAANVLDITSTIAYIMDDDPEPFLFDAADVNMDGQINVLDIVGVVNIILGGGALKPAAVLANAVITLSEDHAMLSIDGPLAGLQYVIHAESLSAIVVSPLPSLELVTHERADIELLVLAFSFDGKTVPPGDYVIATHPEGLKPMIMDAVAADPRANGVEVLVAEGDLDVTAGCVSRSIVAGSVEL